MWKRQGFRLAILATLVTGSLAAAAAAAGGANPKTKYYETLWRMEEPVESIQGTYELIATRYEDSPPILASVWSITDADFDIVAWPPRYCHAIHVCFIPSAKTDFGNLHIESNFCGEKFVKWYPHIAKVDVQDDAKKPIVTKFNQRHSLRFRKVSANLHALEVTDQSFERFVDFKVAKVTNVSIGLTGMQALILTNSRFCIAHMSVSDNINQYQAVLAPSKAFNKSMLAMFSTSHNQPQGQPSIFKPIVTVPSSKGVDLLHHIKTLKPVVSKRKGQKKRQCPGFRQGSENSLKTTIGTVSADSWTAGIQNAQAPNRIEQFTIRVGGECSWLRIWVSADSAHDMSTYAKDFKVEDSIDFFFDQQFMVPPDSDEARPLFGNSTHIGVINVRRFAVENPQDAARVVEVSYGRDRGPALPFIEYFHMPSFHGGPNKGTSFRITLIKAPKCEAVIVPETQRSRLFDSTPLKTNTLAFQNCERTIFQ